MSEIARDRDDMALQELLSSVERPLDATLLERARDLGARHFGSAGILGGLLPEGAILGSYKIERVLGVGGQAAVYLGRHLRLPGRLAALKVPHGETTSRMLREADAMARLDHPGILGIVDVEPDGEIPYLVLDYCTGGSLADRIADGPLSEDETLRVLRVILEALTCAHDQSIIHRDLKPENILFDGQGNARIADFGLGKVVAEQLSLSLSQGTRTGIAGTPTYMAPEQERPGAPVDGRTDLYAVGKLIYAMLTGESPRTLRPIERSRQDLQHPWSELVFKLTEGFPDARPVSARAVLEQLEGWGAPVTTSMWKRTESQVSAFSARIARDPGVNQKVRTLTQKVLSSPTYTLAFVLGTMGALAIVLGEGAGFLPMLFGFILMRTGQEDEQKTRDAESAERALAEAPPEVLDETSTESRRPTRSAPKTLALVMSVIGFVVTFFTAMGGTVALVFGTQDHIRQVETGGMIALTVAGFFLVGSFILWGVRQPAGLVATIAKLDPPTPPTPPTTPTPPTPPTPPGA